MENQPISPYRMTIIAAVFVVGIVVFILLFEYRPTWVEPVATVLLVCVTAVYVLLTHDTLKVAEKQFDLLKDQNDRQDQVLLFVDLAIDPPELKVRQLSVRVSNLGLSNVLIQSFKARTSDEPRKTHTLDLQTIVQSGKTEAIPLPRFLYDWESDSAYTDFEFTVHYVGIKETGSTTPKCFNVCSFSAEDDYDETSATNVINIKDGLDAIWKAICPKCSVGWPIDVSGLKSFDVVIARMNQVQRDMAISCPDHKSEYMMSDQTIKAAQKKKENRYKL
jgi:Ca2+/Na+ antiporter